MKLNPNFVFLERNIRYKRVIALQGGTRSGKTYSALQWIIKQCVNYRGLTISVVRATLPALKASAMRDFVEIMTDLGLYSESNHNLTENVYHLNGNQIEFFSIDNEQKLRGRKRDLLFVNEANEISLEQWRQLVFRTTGRIIIDYNPSMHESYIYEHVLTREDCGLLITTYRDNPHLSPEIVKEIESLQDADPEYWKVFGMGERGMLRDVIFGNWETVDVLPSDAKLICYGMDFGYSNDPTALVGCYQMDGKYYFKEHLYRTHMTNPEVGNFMKSIGVSGRVVCDSAEPKSIQELRNMGFNCEPAKKGQDSIRLSIDALQRSKFYVTKDSTNLIKELRAYTWKRTRDGVVTDEPIDFLNHAIDATRYIALNNFVNINKGVYSWR